VELAFRFRVLKVLGQGTFGCVHQVEDTADGQLHAAKVFVSAGAETDAREEALVYNALDRARHPSFLTMVFNGASLLPAFIVLPMMPDSLAAIIARNGAVDLPEGLAIMEQARGGLQHLHTKAGFLHMDVKPGNILYRASTRHAVLVDFSLAELWPQREDAPPKWKSHGTAPYRAPELWEEKPGVTTVGPAGDAWALGCTAFEMATGMKFFSSAMAPATRRAATQEDLYLNAVVAYCAERRGPRAGSGPFAARAVRCWPVRRDVVWGLLHPQASQRLGLDKAAWDAITEMS
jgi:serine/threonine protein kinase